jgi:cellulose synthase/poly-beta-1,6-N-acetylglucosamine synthase-like glycosyltransferase
MNDGVTAARGDVVARVDAHSRIAPDYLRRVVAALRRHPEAAAVGGPFLPEGTTPMERAVGVARSSWLGVGGGYGTDRTADDHGVRSVQCGAYWRDAILDVGLFDPAMVHGEDEELNWRLVQGGWAIVLCPALRQPYRPRGSAGAVLRQYWNYGQGRARVLYKHPDYLRPRHLAPSALILTGIALTLATLFGTGRATFALEALGLAYAVGLVVAGLRTRDVRQALRVAVAIGCMHAGYGAGMIVQACRLVVAKPQPCAERDEFASAWPQR